MKTPSSGAAPARAAAAREIDGRERALRLVLLVALLYLFLVGVETLGDGIASLGSGVTENLFRGVSHPLGGLAVGILATVLVQSSSVTTATIVALVGAGVISLGDGVPMVMGANIGTTITATLVSLGTIRRPEEFRRAFAGATMHDFFNILCVILLLPLELATGVLSTSAVWLSDLVGDAQGGEFSSPLDAVVAAGSGVVERAAQGLSGAGVVAGVLLIVAGLALIFST
ncbi:MAG: Na/Pi symporter, partial [Egibacteraceae bacterium]